MDHKKGISRRSALKIWAAACSALPSSDWQAKTGDAQESNHCRISQNRSLCCLGWIPVRCPKLSNGPIKENFRPSNGFWSRELRANSRTFSAGMSVDSWAAYNTGVGPGQNNFFGSHPWTLYDRTAYQTSGINRLFRLHAATVPFMLAEAGVRVGLLRDCDVLAS